MARLAKFSDAMSSMDVNCAVRMSGVYVESRTETPLGTARARWRGGVRGQKDINASEYRARAPSLCRRGGFFVTDAASDLAPLLLGDEVRHLRVHLLEGLQTSVAFD